MAAPSSVLGAVLVVGSSGENPRLVVDCIGMFDFVLRKSGVVRILAMFLFASFNSVCVVCGVVCDWVDLRLSRARYLRRMALEQRSKA